MSKGESPLVHRIPVKDKSGRVIGEKEVVSYRGLLDMVHRERLAVIETTLVQAPTKDNGDNLTANGGALSLRKTRDAELARMSYYCGTDSHEGSRYSGRLKQLRAKLQGSRNLPRNGLSCTWRIIINTPNSDQSTTG